jgi:soluble lytic murein transglycosylase
MHRLAGSMIAGAIVFGVWAGAADAQTGTPLSPDDRLTYGKAFTAAEKKQWSKAMDAAAKGGNALATNYFRWRFYTQPGAEPSFEEIASFIDSHREWPRQARMLRNAEALLQKRPASDDLFVLDWFGRYPPVSTTGKWRLAEAQLRNGLHDQGYELLREAWIEGNFARHDERTLLRRHRQLLTRDDHAARLDRLLWDRRRGDARRLLPRVEPDLRTLGLARIGLIESAGNVDTLIANVPETLRDNPGLAFERARWRRTKGFDERAREILLEPRLHEHRADKWWRERRIHVRKALAEGELTDAYVVATLSDLEPGGADYAEAEWLAGWVALRFLDQPSLALDHFARLHSAVLFPVSVSRAAYWAGRAAEDLDDPELATQWYEDAALYPLTYHGQLAIERLGTTPTLSLPEEPTPTIAEAEEFPGRELARMTRLLNELGENRLVDPFLLHLDRQVRTAGERVLVAVLAENIGRRDLTVRVAKNAERDGVYLPNRAYPVIDMPSKYVEDAALLLAMSRQESAFDPQAISHAGARGLMQLMPATARRTAKKINVPYSPDKLTSDPQYNATLGSAHLAELLENFDGNYVLAVAAYNAGGGRVRRWLRQNGDPRTGEVDAVDWIELIPFTETRDYVQRVMGNLQVYRTRLAQNGDVQLRLTEDLTN